MSLLATPSAGAGHRVALAAPQLQRHSQRWRWPVWSAAALGAVALGWLYGPVLARLVAQWRADENYSYGFLVAPFCAWLVWRQRQRLRNLPAAPDNAGLLVIFAALALLLAGRLGAELLLTRVSLPLLLAGLTLFLGGRQWLCALAFPLGFLLFMIPLPTLIFNLIALPMQSWATQLGVGLVSWTGLPILREGNLIELPHLSLDVIAACSGIRSLLALVALAVGFGYLVESRWASRLLLAVAMLPLAIVSNAVRIGLTILLAFHFGDGATAGVWHLLTGLEVFAVSLCGLLLVQRGLHTAFPATTGACP